MINMETVLSDLQAWYAAQCDGEWEHEFGIEIKTMDNPGWSLRVNLEDTLLEDKSFGEVKRQDSKDSWVQCFIEGKYFIGFGGPHQLTELLTIFLDWAKTEPDWLAVQYETEEQARDRKDKELWAVLGDEVGPELCRAENCTHPHIRYSAFCRRHHFEMMRGYAPPEDV
ncbi:MAG: immunity 53 family protein [Abitibacteriaceae bacterium]|nr:immunity 53 family protein [Abditibacteriaceae bacterium]